VTVTPIPVVARAEDRIDEMDEINLSDDAVDDAVGGVRRPWPGFIKDERSTGGRVDCIVGDACMSKLVKLSCQVGENGLSMDWGRVRKRNLQLQV
jgi:hypothetical protein